MIIEVLISSQYRWFNVDPAFEQFLRKSPVITVQRSTFLAVKNSNDVLKFWTIFDSQVLSQSYQVQSNLS